jgi:hypothetical protein
MSMGPNARSILIEISVPVGTLTSQSDGRNARAHEHSTAEAASKSPICTAAAPHLRLLSPPRRRLRSNPSLPSLPQVRRLNPSSRFLMISSSFCPLDAVSSAKWFEPWCSMFLFLPLTRRCRRMMGRVVLLGLRFSLV